MCEECTLDWSQSKVFLAHFKDILDNIYKTQLYVCVDFLSVG